MSMELDHEECSTLSACEIAEKWMKRATIAEAKVAEQVATIEQMAEALKASREVLARQSRAIGGNTSLPGDAGEFYKGYNAVVYQERDAANKLLPLIDAALSKHAQP